LKSVRYLNWTRAVEERHDAHLRDCLNSLVDQGVAAEDLPAIMRWLRGFLDRERDRQVAEVERLARRGMRQDHEVLH
jgi:hypothetical protein